MDEANDTMLTLSEPSGEHTPLVRSSEFTCRSRYDHHLPRPVKVAYALGHVFNDISAAMWFSYMLLFLQMVLGMKPALSGVMLLIGQLSDGICTPVVGIMADRIGSRKTWHIIGSVLALLSFPLLFAPCPGCTDMDPTSTSWLMAVYYAALIIVFQASWAIVQISHLALITDLTPTQQGRAELTAIRYTASVCSSVAVYIITWSVFHTTKGTGLDKIGPDDEFKFQDVVIIAIAIGITTNSLFHFGLHKVNIHTIQSLITEQESSSTSRPSNYLRSPTLFQVALLYVTSRLFLTISLVYLPLYLNESLTEGQELLASVPLVCYLSSFIASIGIRYVNSLFGSKLSYLCGVVISIFGCMWIRYGMAQQYLPSSIYGVAVLFEYAIRKEWNEMEHISSLSVLMMLIRGSFDKFVDWWQCTTVMQREAVTVMPSCSSGGAGSSVTMVTSLCITADLIGSHTENGAFIYSAVTFADKVLNGVAVVIIEDLKCTTTGSCPHYYRNIIAYVCGSSAVLGLIVLTSLYVVNIPNSWQQYIRK